MSARWDADAGKWHLRIRRPSSLSDGKTEDVPPSPASSSRDSTLVDEEYEDFEDTADVLFLGTGALSRWSWPDIEGLNNFKGRLLHSAQWDVTDGAWEEGVKDWNKKDVGVIGLVWNTIVERLTRSKELDALAALAIFIGFNRSSNCPGTAAKSKPPGELRAWENMDCTVRLRG